MFSDLTICWQSKYIYNGDIQNRRHKPLGRNVKPDTITTRRHESRTKFASFRVPSRASCTLWKNKTNISISIKCEEPQETVPRNTMDGRKQTIKSQYLWPRGLSSACFARLLAAIPKRASDYSVSWTETIKTCVPNRQMNNSNVPQQHWLVDHSALRSSLVFKESCSSPTLFPGFRIHRPRWRTGGVLCLVSWVSCIKAQRQ